MLDRIRRFGPVSFAEFMDLALYDPGGGFFARGGCAGRRGDFLTSPEVGPLFGAVVARALDTWWAELDRPDPYVVAEAGAGAGALAAAVLAAGPECMPALRYVLVERSEALRAAQRARLHPWAAQVTSRAELPDRRFTGVVLANELLDNLPFHLLERSPNPEPTDGGSWREVRLGEEGGALAEVLVPAAPELADEAEGLAPDAPAGARLPLQLAARSWLTEALALVERGRVVVIDYADSSPSLAVRPPPEWLRTYRSHGRGSHPLENPGSQDVTCEVAVDQLAKVRPLSADRPQAEFLRAHGIDELVAAARAAWQERAHVGDLEALKARSRVSEAAALTDPAGLGAFRVFEWSLS